MQRTKNPPVLSTLGVRLRLPAPQILFVLKNLQGRGVCSVVDSLWKTQPLQPLKDVRHSWEKTLKEAGIPRFVLYNLRHSYESRLSAAGVSDLFVAQMIGQ